VAVGGVEGGDGERKEGKIWGTGNCTFWPEMELDVPVAVVAGGRRWRTVGLRDQMERGRKRFGGKILWGRKWLDSLDFNSGFQIHIYIFF
jgi:hypothetical protein